MVDTRAFDDFFRIEYPKLVAVAAALTGDRDLARDIAQESLFRACRAWDTVSGLDRPGAWTRRVALNLVTDNVRRGARDRRLAGRLASAPGGASDETPSGPDEPFWRAVRRLPERQRVVVALHYLADRSVDEVAATMGIAPGTVKATLSHARRSLARSLDLPDVQRGDRA